MSAQTFDEIVSAVDAVRVDTPDGFDTWPVPIFPDSDQFPAWTRVSRGQAIEAVKRPASIAVYEAADLRWFLATRLARGASYLVLLVGAIEGTQRLVQAGFRVRGSAELANDPTRAFATLLSRCGLDYNGGQGRVRFAP